MCDHRDETNDQEATTVTKETQSTNLRNILIVIILVFMIASAFLQGYIFGYQRGSEQSRPEYIYEYYEPTPPLMENVQEDRNSMNTSRFSWVIDVLCFLAIVAGVIFAIKFLYVTVTIPGIPREDQFFVDYLD